MKGRRIAIFGLEVESEKCGKYDCVHLSINALNTTDDCTELRHFMWVPAYASQSHLQFTVWHFHRSRTIIATIGSSQMSEIYSQRITTKQFRIDLCSTEIDESENKFSVNFVIDVWSLVCMRPQLINLSIN